MLHSNGAGVKLQFRGLCGVSAIGKGSHRALALTLVAAAGCAAAGLCTF